MNELKNLEKIGAYLFHGSKTSDIKSLEPRQAMSLSKPDGEPAVFASEYVEPAIFMAVIGSRKVGAFTYYEKSQSFDFFIAESHMVQARIEQWIGYVYVLSPESFKKRYPGEWASSKVVEPITIIQVGIEDLPTNMSIISDDDFFHRRYLKSS